MTDAAEEEDEEPPGLDPAELERLLRLQDGVVSRRQLRELGARPWDVRRLLRRRDLSVIHPGVYVNHTGPLSSAQRRWAAVQAHWPAALALTSVLPDFLDDIAAGACSVLEREFMRLEELHGLPPADRQRPASINGRQGYRDVTYVEHRTVVELDGRVVHGDDPKTWDADHERDLRAALDQDALTIRLTYGQVFRHGCRTIAAVAELLARRGWSGELRQCPDCFPGEEADRV